MKICRVSGLYSLRRKPESGSERTFFITYPLPKFARFSWYISQNSLSLIFSSAPNFASPNFSPGPQIRSEKLKLKD